MSGAHFDAVIVGSGFGGSVMAYRLATAGLTVCVLERGKRYPPGSFARSPREMRNNFWDPSSGRQGLFQVWSFDGIDGVVSAGLGGGSLIYANVLIRKDEQWFVQRRVDGSSRAWPVTRAELDPHYDNVEGMLKPQHFPLDKSPYSETLKTKAFRDAAARAGLEWSLPPLAVSFAQPGEDPVPGEPIRGENGRTTDNLHHRTRSTCRLCGECDVGCNFGSKNTLDYNYLTEAAKAGAELWDRCEVRAVAPLDGGGYRVDFVRHRAEDEGLPSAPLELPVERITGTRLILSAGTFGTGFLLLKNRRQFPGLSDRLGQFVSGNGDFLGIVRSAHEQVQGKRVARPLDPSHGSVITSTVRVPDVDDGGDGPGFYVQDGGYPGFVDWLAEVADEPGALVRALKFAAKRLLGRLTRSQQTDLDGALERLIGDAHTSSSLLPLLGMGMDTPDGVMGLGSDGMLSLKLESASSSEYFSRVIETMQRIAQELGGELVKDPLWHLRKRLITVHPVGGCSMAVGKEDGVVNKFGEVFGYPGLVIADGSVMPGPVGPNPSFTIAALADRFAQHIVETGGG